MELFEEIRREHEFGVGTIQGVSRKLGVHRRMVRQPLSDAVPPARKSPERRKPRLEPVMEMVRAAFRPEFLNRLDEILLFHRLTRAHMTAIVEIQLGRLQALLDDRDIALEFDAAAKAWLGDAGYDPAYGARPLKRVVQRVLQNPIASLILEGRIADGDRVHVGAGEGGLVINGETAAAA